MHHVTEVFVDVFDHAEATSGAISVRVGPSDVGEPFRVFFWCDVWCVWCVGGDVGEVGFLGIVLFFNPAESSVEEEVGAVALGFYDLVVMEEDVVVVGVFFIFREVSIGGLAYSSRSVDEGLCESAVVW